MFSVGIIFFDFVARTISTIFEWISVQKGPVKLFYAEFSFNRRYRFEFEDEC